MIRSFLGIGAFLLACVTLAAPAPKPQPFVLGWDKPVDPDQDCTIKREKGVLIMDMPGRDHDYNPRRGKVNAPRLLREREIEGDFVMQVHVRIDARPSEQSSVDGQRSSVWASFLVILPEKAPLDCIRMDFGASRNGNEVDGYTAYWKWFDKNGQNGKIIERGLKGDAYLRLDRRDGDLIYSISSDGENWKGLCATVGIREKLKVGLVACSFSTDPSKIQFDKFKLSLGKKKEQP